MNEVRLITSAGDILLSQYEDSAVKLTYQVSDIKSGAKSGNYSQTIRIPATSENNTIFGHLFDVNLKDSSGTMRDLRDIRIEVGGTPVIYGQARVTVIGRKAKPEYYEVNIIGSNPDFFTDTDALKLTDLDLGTHQYDKTTVEGSWTNVNSDFVYAPVNYGEWDNKTHVALSDIRPHTRLRSIIKAIVNGQGYKLVSNFLDSDYGKNLFWLFVGDNFRNTDAYVQQMLFKANLSADQTVTAAANVAFGVHPFSSDGTFDNGDPDPHFITTAYAVLTTAGRMRFQAKVVLQHSGTTGQTATGNVKMQIVRGASTIDIKTMNYRLNISTGGTAEAIFPFDSGFMDFQQDDIIRLRITPTLTEGTSLKVLKTLSGTNSEFWNEVSNELVETANIDLAKTFPSQYSQGWLIDQVARLFNCQYYADNVRKVFYFEPYDDFYYNIGEAEDWTKRLDNSRQTVNSFLGDNLRQEQLFEFAKDSNDALQKQIDDKSDIPFLSYLHTLPKRFQKGRDSKKTDFSPTLLMKDTAGGMNMIIPRLWNDLPADGQKVSISEALDDYFAYTQYPAKSYDFQPRIVYYEGQVSGDWYWYYEKSNPDAHLTVYPRMLQYDPAASSEDNNSVAFANLTYQNGLFYRYYANMYREIEEGLLRKSYFYLDENKIASLDLRKPIKITDEDGDSYWKINSVNQWDALEPTMPVQVELIKMLPYRKAVAVNKRNPHYEPPPGTVVPKNPVIPGKGIDPRWNDGQSAGVDPQKQGFVFANGTGNQTEPGSGGVAGGVACVALGDQQVYGKYNSPDRTALFIVGGGTDDDNRANAMYVTQNSSTGDFEMYVNGSKVMTAATSPTVSGTANQLAYFTGPNAVGGNAAFVVDATNKRIGVNVATPSAQIHAKATTGSAGSPPFRVDDSSGNAMLYVDSDGRIGVKGNGTGNRLQVVNGAASSSGAGLNLYGSGEINMNQVGSITTAVSTSWGSTGGLLLIKNNVNFNPTGVLTTVEGSQVLVQTTFNPAAGDIIYSTIRANPTINQTGSASGVTSCFKANPTITAAVDHRLFYGKLGSSSHWGVLIEGTSSKNGMEGKLVVGGTTFSGSEKLRVNGDVRVENNLNVANKAGIGTTSTPNSTLDINGSFGAGVYKYNEGTGATTVDGSATIWIFTGAAANVSTLPALASCPNRVYIFKNRGTYALTLAAFAAEQLYYHTALSPLAINPGEAYMIVNAGDYWEATKMP